MRRALVIAIALSVLLPVTAVAASPQAELFRAVNKVRAHHGLPPVKHWAPLMRAARAHSRDMLQRDYFLHDSGPGGEPFSHRLQRFLRRHAPARVGEVLAWGVGDEAGARSAVQRWLQSPPHRAVLLRRGFRRIGIGAVRGTFKGYSGAVIYTVDLGTR